MTKIILLLCAVLAVAKGDPNSVSHHKSMEARVDDYIRLNRQQHSKNIAEYDAKLEHFKEFYLGRADGLNIQLDLVTDTIVQNEEVFNPLEILSDLSKECVSKHRQPIPNENYAKNEIRRCLVQASNQIDDLLSKAIATRNSLEGHYKNNFEHEVINCGKKYAYAIANYTVCVTTLASDANQYTIQNQKLFEIQLEAAECTAKLNIKSAFDCSYAVQTRVLSAISEANVLINNCLTGEDQCEPCHERGICEETLTVDSGSYIINNPFYKRNDNPSCITILKQN